MLSFPPIFICCRLNLAPILWYSRLIDLPLSLGARKMTSIRNSFVAAAFPIVAFALTPSGAVAQGYSGNWPVNVDLPPHFGHKACLTLVDNGTGGAPHSGPASISGPLVGGTLPYGTFQVISHLLVVTIQAASDTGSDAGLVFIAPASDGDLGKGVFENVYGGEDFLSGALTFGTKGGC
jgi:hypothetical protein